MLYKAVGTALLACSMIGAATAEAEGSRRLTMTVYERQSDDGPRHSPLFNLPVSDDETAEFPMKMVLFNNDLYSTEEGLLADDERGAVGYEQVCLCCFEDRSEA